METIQILSEVHTSLASHKNSARRLQSQLVAGNDNSISVLATVLRNGLDPLLLVGKKEAAVERSIKFLTEIFVSCNEWVLSQSIYHLLDRCGAADKTVRIRACQILAAVMSKMSLDAEISDDLWDEVVKKLSPRLRDKNPTVRMWAVKALGRLQILKMKMMSLSMK